MGGHGKDLASAEAAQAEIMLACVLKQIGGSVTVTKGITLEDVEGIVVEQVEDGVRISLDIK